MIQLSEPEIGQEELQQIAEVFERGQLTRGPEVSAFESEFAKFCGADHGIATSSGTTALHTAFEALGIGEDDRVALSPFSFVASANAIRWCGAEPVFVDIREETYNIDPEALRARLQNGEQIDAVLAVHLFGLPCDMAALHEPANEYDFKIIEDGAQAHGATFDDQPVGSLGDAACFSFFPSKNMTTGEGGMVVTDRAGVAESARQFIEHGKSDAGYADLGHNFCMSDILAAIGRVQLEKLPENTTARRENASLLSEVLDETPVETPVEPGTRRHVYHQYTIRTEDRDSLQNHLAENGVQTGTYYDTPIHDQPAYSNYTPTLPTADTLKQEVLSLPVHPNISEHECKQVGRSVREFFDVN